MGNGGADVGSNQSPEKVIRVRAVSRASILAFQTSTMQMQCTADVFFFFDDSQNRTPRYQARNTSGLYQLEDKSIRPVQLSSFCINGVTGHRTRNAKMPATLFEVVHFKHALLSHHKAVLQRQGKHVHTRESIEFNDI